MKGKLIVPLKWIAAIQRIWYLEKVSNSDVWVRVSQNQPNSTYKELAAELDIDGYPFVILKLTGFLWFFKLTESMLYQGVEFSNITSEYRLGFWAKKEVGKRNC